MPGELVTAATVLAGSGAATWLADKLLGPSADGLGEQLKAFAGERIRKIFVRASAQPQLSKLKSLPPGFAYQAIQKASFSEDDELITEMWANLLIEAGSNYRVKHALFADILSQIGGDEARALDEIVPLDHHLTFPAAVPVNVRSSVRQLIENQVSTVVKTGEEATHQVHKLGQYRPYWPSIITNASVPYRESGNPHVQWAGGGRGTSVAHEVLIRQQLIDRFEFDLEVMSPPARAEGLIVTGLGLEFLYACRGCSNKPMAPV